MTRPLRSLAIALAALCCMVSATAQTPPPGVDAAALQAERPAQTLSAYRLFLDAGARTANAGVTPYGLNTELYSDGALKFRYVWMPPGASAAYREEGALEFPIGTVLIKTFAFAADMRQPTQNIRFLETRLLIRRAEGWVALPYVWNDAQTEATYAPIGATLPTDVVNEASAPTHLEWDVPNRNQCKGCHDVAGEIAPIGPTARNLNRAFANPFAATEPAPADHQLLAWAQRGMLTGAPTALPAAPDTSIDARARAYLHVNCAHCHNPQGPAHTSGLDLRWSTEQPAQWGVNKRPVAAGRASANMEFSIAPGDANRSILLHRMESLDPGVMMPELGRQTVDARGVALIREWIGAMGPDGRPRE